MLMHIEGLGAAPGDYPALIGSALGQSSTVSQQEVITELTGRGYRIASTPISPPVSPPISPPSAIPTITRPQAISQGVDRALRLYGLALRCTKLGGCALQSYQWTGVVSRAAQYATEALQRYALQPRSPSISPAPTSPYLRLRGAVSTRLSGIGARLYATGGLGQDYVPIITQPPTVTPPDLTQPGMTQWDWVNIISQAVQGAASTLQAYAIARAQRERAGQTATLTADQVKQIVNQALIQNPNLDRAQLIAAAAGAGGDKEPKGTPGWVIPAVIGGAVVVVMGGMGRGGR